MYENQITQFILDASFTIHKELGPGLFESVYESVLAYELIKEYGLCVQKQVPIAAIWKNVNLDIGFRADIIVENKVIVEIKSIETLAPVHSKQVLTYLRLSKLKVGLLINFNEQLLKNGIKRLVNNF